MHGNDVSLNGRFKYFKIVDEMKAAKSFTRMLQAVFLIATASCNVLYFPNSYNSPMFRGKGDAQVNVLAGTPGFDVQTAYAITDGFGIMANGQFHQSTENDSIKEQRTLQELGMGYTKHFSSNGVFEFFGGGGLGEVPANFRDSEWNGKDKAQLKRIFIQPGVGYCNDWLDISFVNRLSGVNIGGETNWFYEPGFMSKMGYKQVRFYTCIGISLPFTYIDKRDWNYNPFTFSAGLHVNFGRHNQK